MASSVERLLDIMRTLRSERGCPWDREQSLESLKPYLLEESHEVIDAIDAGDREALKEELGDLLLQVVFQSQICAEEGSFDFRDVAQVIVDKLIRRHPHVFGEVEVSSSEEVLENWRAIKAQEKPDRPASVLSGVPRSMPALLRAQEVQARAARRGFDWDKAADVLGKIDEEVRELKKSCDEEDAESVQEELGDLFFTLVNYTRHAGFSAERVMARAVEKFADRYDTMCASLRREGVDPQAAGLDKLEEAWQRAKAAGGNTSS